MTIEGVAVEFPADMNVEEAKKYAYDEFSCCQTKGRRLSKIVLSLSGDEVIVKSFEKSPIRRVRRITGYLSEVNNFNDAKRHELQDRKIHF